MADKERGRQSFGLPFPTWFTRANEQCRDSLTRRGTDPVDLIERVGRREFLTRIRARLPQPPKIWYPGCGDDEFLEEAFKVGEIYYTDEGDDSFKKRGRPNFHLGDYREAPYGDDFFDALVYKDCHADMPAFLTLLRSLKQGGLVIREDYTCDPEEFEPEEMRGMAELRELDLPYRMVERWGFFVFEKVLPTPPQPPY